MILKSIQITCTLVLLLVTRIESSLVPGALIQNVDYAEDSTKNFTKSLITIGDKEFSGCDLESSLYCTQVDNYPVVQIESLVEKYLNKGVYFVGSDTMNHELKQRSNFVANDEHLLCETDRSAIFPKMMKNRRDEPTLIVQSRQLKQMIIVERCRRPNEGCSDMIMVPALYETYCKQVFSTKTLIAVDPNSDQIYEEMFDFPTCCQCAIRSVLY